MPNNANFLAKGSKALPSSYFSGMGKSAKPNPVDQDNPTNPQANGYGGGGTKGVQGQASAKLQSSKPYGLSVTKSVKTIAKPSMTNRMNNLIGGK